jgi:hypothetical protein
MRRSLFFLAAACWAFRDSSSSFELRVRGAVSVTARGSVEVGATGTAEERYYTITLGGPDGAAAVVFTRAGSASPSVGVYPVGEREFRSAGFSGLIITGMPAHPTGVFRAQGGTLTITAATPERLTGQFELRAVGFLTESPTQDRREVTAVGSFATESPRDTIRTLSRERGR